MDKLIKAIVVAETAARAGIDHAGFAKHGERFREARQAISKAFDNVNGAVNELRGDLEAKLEAAYQEGWNAGYKANRQG